MAVEKGMEVGNGCLTPFMDINSTLIVDSGVARNAYLPTIVSGSISRFYPPVDGNPAGETVRSISPIPLTSGS